MDGSLDDCCTGVVRRLLYWCAHRSACCSNIEAGAGLQTRINQQYRVSFARGAHGAKGRSVTQRSFIGHRLAVTFAASAFALVATLAEAQTPVRIAKQFGIAYLPLTIMEQKQVLEEHGRRRGLDLKTEWMQFVSGARMNEAILSGDL